MVLGSAVLMSSGVFGGFAMDAHIYYRGAAAWLAGTDPWLASYMVNSYSYHFAALPWALPFVAPLTLLPEDVAAPLMVVLSTAAAAVILRRSGLSIWWLLFPPLSQGVFNGNPCTPEYLMEISTICGTLRTIEILDADDLNEFYGTEKPKTEGEIIDVV